MKYALGLLLLMIFAVSAGLMAQQNPSDRPVVIQGKVIADAPVSFSTVALLRARDSSLVTRMVTDSSGGFSLKVKTGDACLLSVSHVGFNTAWSPVFSPDTAKEGLLHFSIRLSRNATQLKGVEVIQPPVIERKLDRIVVRVDNNIVSAGESVMELLRTLPGIVIDGTNNIYIKGKSDIRVMIDGRDTYLKDDQLKIMLANMSANNVQKIEIISNPPAKYAAEGAGGIINIITKTRETTGVSGNIYSTYAQGVYGRIASGGVVNFKSKRLLLTGSYDLTHSTGFTDGDETRKYLSYSPVITFRQVSSQPATSTNHYYKAGADWSITRSQHIAVSFDGSVSGTDKSYYSTLDMYQDPHTIDSSYSIDNFTKTHYTNANLNADYTLRLDTSSQVLTANYSHLRFYTHENNSYHSLFFNSDGENPRQPQLDTSYNKASVRVDAYKLDYKRNLPAKVLLEAGLKYTATVTDNDIVFYTFQNGAYKTDTSRTNHFIYTENIAAAYFNERKVQFGGQEEKNRMSITPKTN